MKLQKVFSILALSAAIVGLTSATATASNSIPVNSVASTPISVGNVTPYIIPGENSGGNRTCSEVGLAYFNNADYYAFESDQVNYTSSFGDNFPNGLNITVADNTNVTFNSTFPIGAAIVKGGNAANVYVYGSQATNDSGLASPLNQGGQRPSLSNLTFCWNATACVETVTCSDQCSATETTLDGTCGPVICSANAPVAQTCPTECGLSASQVDDGQCGYTQCRATEQCTTAASPTPTSNNDKKSDNSKAAVGGIVESQGQVLGATTYAETGVVADALMALVGFGGAGVTTVGYVMNAKKNNK